MRVYLDSIYQSYTDFLTNYLENLGYPVTLLSNTAEAPVENLLILNGENEDEVHLFILHIQFLDSNLMRELQNLYGNNPRVQTILVVNSVNQLTPEQMLEIGVQGVLHKPFQLSDLEYMLIRIEKSFAKKAGK